MTGRMSLPDAAMFKTILTEADVTRFKISGYFEGRLIGTWDSGTRAPDATWHLRFDPAGMAFLTGGRFASFRLARLERGRQRRQIAAAPVSAFNSGDFSQDLCRERRPMSKASSIDARHAARLLLSTPVTPDCRNTAAVSKRIRTQIPGKTDS